MTTRTVERIGIAVTGIGAAIVLGALIVLAKVGDEAGASVMLLVLCIVLWWLWLDVTEARRARRRAERIARAEIASAFAAGRKTMQDYETARATALRVVREQQVRE